MLVLTGAGIQTASGIPDFRGLNGIYTKNKIKATEILTERYFREYTEDFYEFYTNNLLYPEAEPNIGHRWLKELENHGKSITIITQNIDGLHTKAGSQDVYEIHGNAQHYICTFCKSRFNTNILAEKWPKKDKIVPICPFCKHVLKPDIVLYEDPIELPESQQIYGFVEKCDLVLILGTQLEVQPANLIPVEASEKVPIYIINLTDYRDNQLMKNVDYELIQEDIQKFVEEMMGLMGWR